MINLIIGGLIGVGLMCLLQINRDNELIKENKRLKEEYMLLTNASEEYEDKLQQRIDKAIEYIKDNGGYCEQYNMCSIPFNTIKLDDLLEILGGKE